MKFSEINLVHIDGSDWACKGYIKHLIIDIYVNITL
jgi:hypothetical protein